MNTKARTLAETEAVLSEELRARVPEWMKTAVSNLATERVLQDADIVREAVREYLERRHRRQTDPKQKEMAL